MKPDISFVIPCFNDEAWLAEAVQSCLMQTNKNIEVVVVDDGSTDSTQRLLEYFSSTDKRFRFVNHVSNKGRGAARNTGCDAAHAEVISVLDSDDISDIGRAKETLKKITDGTYFYGAAQAVNIVLEAQMKIQPAPFDLKKSVESGVNGIVHSTVSYHKKLWEKFPYDHGEYAALGLDDWKQQLDMARAGVKFDFTPIEIAAYRMRAGSISSVRNKEEVKKLKNKYLEEAGLLNATAA